MEIHPLLDPFALARDSDFRYEIIKSGNVAGDDGNWSWIVVGDNCELQVKISGVWKIARKFNRPK